MKNNHKLVTRFLALEKAIIALEKIVKVPMDEDRRNIDATIQRFEFTIELFWKLLKAILELRNVEITYSREVLKAAYKGYLIDDEEVWLNMIKDRTQTSHTYDEDLADKIYEHIIDYVPTIRKSFDQLKKLIART